MVKGFHSVITSKTRIRMATAADADVVAAIENDVELKRLLGGPSGKSEEFYRKFLSDTKDLGFLVVESLTTGISIGVCGLLTGSHSDDCENRVVLMKDYWRQGL